MLLASVVSQQHANQHCLATLLNTLKKAIATAHTSFSSTMGLVNRLWQSFCARSCRTVKGTSRALHCSRTFDSRRRGLEIRDKEVRRSLSDCCCVSNVPFRRRDEKSPILKRRRENSTTDKISICCILDQTLFPSCCQVYIIQRRATPGSEQMFSE